MNISDFALHHIDGNPLNRNPSNFKVVNIRENRKGPKMSISLQDAIATLPQHEQNVIRERGRQLIEEERLRRESNSRLDTLVECINEDNKTPQMLYGYGE